MRFPIFKGIKWRLTVVILGTSFVVLFLGAVAMWVYDTINARQNLVSQIDSIAEITAANCASSVAFKNTRDIQDPINALKARREIDAAFIYSADGRLFASFTQSATTTNPPPPFSRAEGYAFEAKRLVLSRKIKFYEDPVGVIIIHANLTQQIARGKTFLLIGLLLLTGLIGVAVLLATRLQRMVSNPIARLATVANHITHHKDYSIRVPSTAPGEIEDLITAFNQMLSEIEQQNRDILESEIRLKLALSAANMCVWEWNIEKNIVTCSTETTEIIGAKIAPMSLEAFCQLVHPEDLERVRSAIQQAVEKQAALAIEYRVLTFNDKIVWAAHHGQLRSLRNGKPTILAGIVQNISARKQAEVERHKLTGKLLQAEEEERRRIARELHDTTAQHLAALKISFTRRFNERSHDTQWLQAETFQLLDQAIQEIRTLTYVLHPPLLDEFGLVGALKDFAVGITRRSGIQVTVGFDSYEGRLPRTIELTLFRVVQESITNAIRHSGTKEVSIRLARDEQEVRVEVQDFGHGMPTPDTQFGAKPPRNSGVGLAAMQERLTMVGGQLTVESDPEGVTVLASVPLPTTAATPSPSQPAIL